VYIEYYYVHLNLNKFAIIWLMCIFVVYRLSNCTKL